MIDYLKNRLKQPSTWLGIAAAVVSIGSGGWVVTPENLSTLLAAIGLIHINESKAT